MSGVTVSDDKTNIRRKYDATDIEILNQNYQSDGNGEGESKSTSMTKEEIQAFAEYIEFLAELQKKYGEP